LPEPGTIDFKESADSAKRRFQFVLQLAARTIR